MEYATGKYSQAICDICGLRCAYRELRQVIRQGRAVNLWVCPDCVDRDQRPRRLKPDREALRHPRPEYWDPSRRILHWKPVDAFPVRVDLGQVEVIL